ncbi:hypothetical protein F2P79_001967 [Pimephales promelas]|nr:hypothetical protein F2P79_001967 [Pimephales promelas]
MCAGQRNRLSAISGDGARRKIASMHKSNKSEALISGDYSSCDEEWLLVIAHTQM